MLIKTIWNVENEAELRWHATVIVHPGPWAWNLNGTRGISRFTVAQLWPGRHR
jgi:hypothetical protein